MSITMLIYGSYSNYVVLVEPQAQLCYSLDAFDPIIVTNVRP